MKIDCLARLEDSMSIYAQPELNFTAEPVMEDITLEFVCEQIEELFDSIESIEGKVQLRNAIAACLHGLSPMAHHPVDFVEWVPGDQVQANDYNPNAVAPPEMELLHVSVAADGFTQPIVTNLEDGVREVVDGFHRNRVGKEYEDVRDTLFGFLPVVQIRSEQVDKADRMASTIRHNRARGKHSVVKMTDIVLELKRRNWTDNKIAKQLGMDSDEVLRLTQIGGLVEAFKDKDFSMAWEVDETGETNEPDLEGTEDDPLA